MEYLIEGRGRNKKFAEAIMPSIISQLKLDNCRKMVQVLFSPECEHDGVAIDLTEATGIYLIVLRPVKNLKDLGITLAHEMVHVKQMAKGTMRYEKNGSIIWAGKKYSKKVNYLDRPWEIEAYSKQEILLRRAIGEK